MTVRPLGKGVLLIAVAACLGGTPAAAQNRGDRQGSDGGAAVARPSSPAPAPAPTPAPEPAPTNGVTSARGDRGGSGTTGGGSTTPATGGGNTPTTDSGSRRRDRGDGGEPAVPRGSRPRTPGGDVVVVPGGYYPWGYGGFGFGGYYGGYYDPWWGYQDPIYPSAPYPSSARNDEGAVRIKVKPRDASVYTDGYYVGHVDDFDGVLQKLHLSVGPHHIEIRDPRYEPLQFDVLIETDQTITYHGEMRKL